jgi:predicted transcriptional regulator
MEALLERPRTGQLTVKLESGERRRLHDIAKLKQRTPHYIMREAINKYVAEEEREQAILKRVDDANEHFERTGLHITLDEVKTWITELRINPNAKLAECHI